MRIGNAAHEQFQLDVYGEVLDAMYQSRRIGSGAAAGGLDIWQGHWSGFWKRPGTSPMKASGKCADRAGISRTPKSWPGSPSIAAVKAVEKFGVEGPVDRWRQCATRSIAKVCSKGFDAN